MIKVYWRNASVFHRKVCIVLAIISELTYVYNYSMQVLQSTGDDALRPMTNRKKDNIDKIHADNVAKPTKFANFHWK